MRSGADVVRLSRVFANMLLATSCTDGVVDPAGEVGKAPIANLVSVSLASILQSWVQKAKTDLRAAYEQPSHGGQIIDGK